MMGQVRYSSRRLHIRPWTTPEIQQSGKTYAP
jgi:hypothetical protein